MREKNDKREMGCICEEEWETPNGVRGLIIVLIQGKVRDT